MYGVLGISILILWPLLHGGIQWILCLRAQKLWVKLIPVGGIFLETLYTLWIYLDPLDQSSGWDELAALIVGIFVLWAAAAVLLAWLIYGLLWCLRKKKQNIS